MASRDLAKHVAEVGRQRKVATFVKLIALQSRPASVNFSAAHAVAQHKHRVRMTVVRAAISILANGAAKLRHRQDHHIVHSLAQVLIKRRDSRAELLQQIAELPARVSLVHVRVPTTDVGKRDFQTHAGFDELRDLQQRIAKRIARILRAVLGFVLRRD